MEDKRFTFLLEAYKSYVEYFSGYADRVSTRFNILLTIDVALAGVYGGTQLNSATADTTLFSALGLIVSVLLYIQSAQDKYVLKRHLARINDIKRQIEAAVGSQDTSALFSPLDDTDLGSRNFVFENLTSWRSNLISLTRVPPITSLVFVIFWVVTFL